MVAGAVALMLEANPGLTPPLVKAIVQYSAHLCTGFRPTRALPQGKGQGRQGVSYEDPFQSGTKRQPRHRSTRQMPLQTGVATHLKNKSAKSVP